MKPPAPPRVKDFTLYWNDKPPEPSDRLVYWIGRYANGYRPNSRVRSMGYYEASEFYGVYIWEYLHVIAGL